MSTTCSSHSHAMLSADAYGAPPAPFRPPRQVSMPLTPFGCTEHKTRTASGPNTLCAVAPSGMFRPVFAAHMIALLACGLLPSVAADPQVAAEEQQEQRLQPSLPPLGTRCGWERPRQRCRLCLVPPPPVVSGLQLLQQQLPVLPLLAHVARALSAAAPVAARWTGESPRRCSAAAAASRPLTCALPALPPCLCLQMGVFQHHDGAAAG